MNQRIEVICLDCGDTLVDEASEVKDASGASLRANLIPGAAELMGRLKEMGYRLALVADGPAATFHNNLGPYGLFDLFDVYAISGEIGVEKPDQRIFQHALEELNVPQEAYGSVLMLGNHLGRDIKGANELGLISVWLDWSPRRHKVPRDGSEVPDHTIHLPLELIPLLERLEK